MEDKKHERWIAEQLEYKKQMITSDVYTWKSVIEGKEVSIGTGEIVEELKYVGGVDISFIKDNAKDACASFTVLSMPDLKLVYEKLEMVELTEPYITSFLAFRECPPLVEVIKKSLQDPTCPKPSIILVDGCGELHPRAFGSASHLGVLLDIPTIGVAKDYFQIPDIDNLTQKSARIKGKEHNKKKGDWLPLLGRSGKIWGAALQGCQNKSNPIYVSVGHKISLETAIQVTTLCCIHKIPEPIRKADLGSRDYLRINGYNE